MHLGQQADALLVHERADHPVDLRMQALGCFLRCLLHGFLHAHGDDAFGQIHAASLELCHGDSLQVDDLDDVQRKPGVLLREAHGLVKRRTGGIGPVERDHNGIVEHCNPLLSPVEPGKARRHSALRRAPNATPTAARPRQPRIRIPACRACSASCRSSSTRKGCVPFLIRLYPQYSKKPRGNRRRASTNAARANGVAML